uniref:Uncharacterized protein n=1 Tax=Chenopodium quinoa TaxID=63459 RepID=A0A803KU23_CHEQI
MAASWVKTITSPFKKACTFLNHQPPKDKKSKQGFDFDFMGIDFDFLSCCSSSNFLGFYGGGWGWVLVAWVVGCSELEVGLGGGVVWVRGGLGGGVVSVRGGSGWRGGLGWRWLGLVVEGKPPPEPGVTEAAARKRGEGETRGHQRTAVQNTGEAASCRRRYDRSAVERSGDKSAVERRSGDKLLGYWVGTII